MKFFRQTKETKRKISFFMALAMVISLLPVSPVAKAAEKQLALTVYSNVSGAAVETVASGATGSAIVTLKSSVANKVISSAAITAEAVTSGAVTSSAVSNGKGNITVVSGSSVTENISVTNIETTKEGICKVTISGIVTASAIILNGTVELRDTSTAPTEEPTEKPTTEPTGEPTEKPTTEPTGEPTATPVTKYNVTVNNSVGSDITLTVGTETIPKGTKNLPANDGDKLEVAVAPNGNYIWSEVPGLTVDNKKAEFTADGAKYVNTVTITKDTTIAVSGGSVTAIPKDVVNTINNSVKPDDASDVPNSEIVLNNIATDVISAIVEKSNGVLTAGAVVEALKDKTTSTIETVYTISKSTSDAAITAIKNGFADIDSSLGITETNYTKAMENGFAVDIEINVIYTLKVGESTVKGTTAITVLKDAVEIKMPVPDDLKDKKDADGDFYAFRLHDGKVTAIPATRDGNSLTVLSDKFSTYVISFVEKEKEDPTPSTEPTEKPTTAPTKNPGTSGGGGAYIPSTSATPAPSATAAPSASPSASADPSATPGADNTAAPAESGAPSDGGDNTTPTNSPAATDKPNDTGKDDTTDGTGPTAVKVGKKATVSGSQYKVTAVKGTRTVQFTKGKKNAKSIVVPSTVKISGKNYKVTTIAKNAFKGNKKLTKVTIGKNVNKIGVSAFQNCSKLKSIVIKSTKLTAKKVGKNAFKGINKKATFKVPKSKVKAYKKIVKAKGAGKNVKVKK